MNIHNNNKTVIDSSKKIESTSQTQQHAARLMTATEFQANIQIQRVNTWRRLHTASNESLTRKQFVRPSQFPTRFRTEDKSERPFAGSRLHASSAPSALPIPSFFERKANQMSTSPLTNTIVIDEEDDIIGFPPSPSPSPSLTASSDDWDLIERPLTPTLESSRDSWDLIEFPLTPITTNDSSENFIEFSTPSTFIVDDSEQYQFPPTPPASLVYYDCAEQRDQLLTLEASLFIFAANYIGNSKLGTIEERLNSLSAALDSSNLASTYNEDFTDRMIELVHSAATEHIKATKADQANTDILDFEALKQIYAFKKDSDTLRLYIRDYDEQFAKYRGSFVENLERLVESTSDNHKSIDNDNESSKKKLEDAERRIKEEAQDAN